jgi:glycine dehydrogenase subunit 1
MATLGKQGLRRIAELCYHKAHYAAARIAEIPNLTVNPHAPDAEFFHEFVVALPRLTCEVNDALHSKHGIIGGYDLGLSYPGQDHRMLIAVTEMNTRAEIDQLVAALRRVAS